MIFVFIPFSLICHPQKIKFGIRGGMNFAWESDHKYTETIIMPISGYKVSGNLGMLVCFPISNDIELESDLLYSLQGYRDCVYISSPDYTDEKKDYYVTSHYLNIPIAVKFSFTHEFYFEFGSQIGFLLGKNQNLDESYTFDMYGYPNTKKIDFGLIAGIGYKISNGIFINARYYHGYTKTSKIYDGGKNRNFQISLGYLF